MNFSQTTVCCLPAKVQQLEAKMMAKPNVRNTREVEKRSVDANTSADDKKTIAKDCPQQVVTYIRWETVLIHMELILFTNELLWEVSIRSSSSNMMCLPLNPMCYSNNQGGSARACVIEYSAGRILNHTDYYNVQPPDPQVFACFSCSVLLL